MISGVELSAREVRAHLAPLLVEIAERIGLDAALKLADAFGGIRIYVPISPGADNVLTACIGLDKARELARYLGSGIATFPTAKPLYTYARDVGIRRAHANRASCRELALRYRLSERRVWEILAAGRAPELAAVGV